MEKGSSKIVLAGDIGGTKTRLGIFAAAADHGRLLLEKTFISKNYPGLEDLLVDFLEKGEKIAAACFGVAGPVIQGKVIAINLPWRLDQKSLQKALSCEKVSLINDLVANAYGIAVLRKNDFAVLNSGKIRQGNAALVSAGTGLGQAILFWNGECHIPSPSEGGHVEFGPRNRLEMELFLDLSKRHGHVSVERLLSGAGLYTIYQFLRDVKKFGHEPAWLFQRMKEEDPAAVISETARLKKNSLCRKALDIFASVYGAVAGNFALQVMAVGGIYLGGGIAPKIVWKLKDKTFMEAFKAKGRLSNLVAQIPVKVILNDRAALYGAAYRAGQLL